MAAATLIIRNISELATCDPSRTPAPGVIENAALAASGETIIYAGPEAGLADVALAPNCIEIDAQQCAVIPGFVDSHTHLVWLGDRAGEYDLRARGQSYQEIAATGGGIRSTVTATAAGTATELVTAAAERAARMLRQGTTTVEIKSGYGLSNDAEMRQLDAARALLGRSDVPDVVTTYLPFHASPDGERAQFLAMVLNEGIPAAADRCEFVDAFCESGAFSIAECRQLFDAAKAKGLGLKLHTEQLTRTGGSMLAAEYGAASADHLDHATAEDLRALAQAGVAGVLLPGASMVLNAPPPPGRALIEAGVTVAIATDCNPGTCYCESMPLITSLAVSLAGLTPAEALVAATRGGAAALRRRDRGVLTPGMRCDFAILNDRHWLDVAYHLGGDVIADVYLRGRPTVR